MSERHTTTPKTAATIMASRVKAATDQANELPLFCNRIAFQHYGSAVGAFLSYLNTWGAALATECRQYNNGMRRAELIVRRTITRSRQRRNEET